jgi:hypothetical protein
MIDWEQQAQGKTCTRCGKKGLGWDKTFHDRTGKWKLENHRREDGKWCNKPPEEMMSLSKEQMQLCPLCDGSNFGLLRSNSQEALKSHLDMWHPEGESMTDLDFKMHNGMPVFYLKYWTHDPHYYKYKHLDK